MSREKTLILNGCFCLIALCISWGLKYHYSIAPAKHLKWILAPTAAMVEVLSRQPFDFNNAAGYMNKELRIIIAPACAGINFMIVAFWVCLLSGIFKFSRMRSKGLWLIGSFAGAFFFTIFVNAVRIWISIFMITSDIHGQWLSAQQVHRITGIVIYFFFLNILYSIMRKLLHFIQKNDIIKFHQEQWKPSRIRIPGASMRYGILPLATYWIIAIGIPALNAAYKKYPDGFREHSLTTGLVSFALFLIFFQVRAIASSMTLKRKDAP